jgi:hypothetical protein
MQREANQPVFIYQQNQADIVYKNSQAPFNYNTNRRNKMFLIFGIIGTILMLIICGIVLAIILVGSKDKLIDYGYLYETEPDDYSYNVTECGKPFYAPIMPNTRIMNGFEANQNSFPWQVSLRYIINNKMQDHFCGGSIISDQWILTAGHCLDNLDIKYIRVVTGLHKRKEIKYKTQIYSVIEKRTNYIQSILYDKDLALLRLDRKIKMGKNAAPICLSNLSATSLNNLILATSGWGDTSGLGYINIPADRLQQVNRRIVFDSDCNFNYFHPWYSDRVLCTKSLQLSSFQSLCKKTDFLLIY